ncbi:hypothetical protein OJ996_07660 [Luteolibacter sp. GHJ8]|uniref:Serine/threonine protein kinase n=1 Tax=Luteolibacter rhizosphaerae TaxID=2989719 RepID=A0ABT3G0T7_9BACT|nr:hypothetical protein [Luteolibacter rhizosphaerae]MCW1913444.1 hypothetical protein [Luteolibacter rhizosphaerae]
MAGRYEILDILAQDASGVVFHAEERDTGRSVVLRRFFPYGPDGGGLQEAERAAYMAALDRVKELRHPTLRTILDGGCDPVDGMPFLVTEWVEGQRLSELLRSRALSPGSTKALISHAIEASQALAGAFGEEAVWVEATPESIVLPVEGEMVTFWICPMKWLASPQKRGGLLPLAELAEKALHWRGKQPAAAGEGLGVWVGSVRTNPNRWSLDEALQALHEPLSIVGQPAASGSVPTIPMKAAKKQAPQPVKKSSSLVPVLLAFLLVAGAGAGAFYFFKLRGGRAAEIAAAKEPAAASALDFGARKTQAGSEATALPVAVVNDPKTQLAGTVKSVKDQGKYRCMELEVDGKPRWIAHPLDQKTPGFDTKELEALKGKRVVVSGAFRKEPAELGEVLHVSDRKQIEVK